MGTEASGLRRIAAATGVYALAGLAQKGLAFFLLPVYTRFIDPAEYGILELLNTFSAVAFGLLAIGLPSAINKCFHRDCPTVDEQRRVLSTALILGLPVVVVGGALFSTLATEISRLVVGIDTAGDLVRLAVAGGVLSTLSALILASLRTQERAIAFSALTLTQFIVALSLNLVLVVKFGQGVRGVLWGNMVSHGVALAAALAVTAPGLDRRPSRRLVGPLLNFGLLLMPVMVAGWIMELSDRYVLRLYSSLEEVAVYGVGYKFGMVLQLAVVWPFQLGWPAVSFSISNREGHQRTYARTLTYLVAVLTFFTLALSLGSRVAVPAIVGEGYRGAYRVVAPVALAYVFNGVHYCVSPGVHVAGKTKYFAPLALLAAAINLALNFLWIPGHGMMGAAWATAAAFFALAMGTAMVGQRYHPVPYEFGRLAKICVSGVLVWLIATRVPPAVSVFSFAWHGILGVAGFPALLVATGFLSSRERALLREQIRRYLPRPPR